MFVWARSRAILYSFHRQHIETKSRDVINVTITDNACLIIFIDSKSRPYMYEQTLREGVLQDRAFRLELLKPERI